MNEHVTVELSAQQRELVLEGLRYVRSSRRLEFREPSAPRDQRRDADLRMVCELIGQLDPAGAIPARAQA